MGRAGGEDPSLLPKSCFAILKVTFVSFEENQGWKTQVCHHCVWFWLKAQLWE